jgi:hypothetical protein
MRQVSVVIAAVVPRRPGPWFIVRNRNGQALAYTHYEVEPGRLTAANVLTRDEEWRIAKLPRLLSKGRPAK